MLPNLFRLTLLLTLTFALLIGAIHTQPYDASELRAFLFPEGCSVACIMGVEANVTSEEDALRIIENHPWVKDVTVRELTNTYGERLEIKWFWNGSQPNHIDDCCPGFVITADIDGKYIVSSTKVITTIPVHELYLLMGETESGSFHPQFDRNPPKILLSYWYEGDAENATGIVPSGGISCADPIASYAKTNSIVTSFYVTSSNAAVSPYTIPQLCRADAP